MSDTQETVEITQDELYEALLEQGCDEDEASELLFIY